MPTDPALHPSPSERAGARPSSGYLPTLDGWRAIAILWVIYAHLGRHPGIPGTLTERFLHGLADWGEHGVQLFFALSGFLICTRLLREEQTSGHISLRSFYTRRLFRIQPPALVYLLFIAVLSLAHVIPSYWNGILGALLMIRNLWPGDAGHAHWYTSHFWSLSVEEHFYLLLPAFLLFVRRQRLRLLLAAFLALELWRVVVFRFPPLQKFGWLVFLRTDLMLPAILFGSAFAVALTKPNLRAIAQRSLLPWVAILYAVVIATFFTLHLQRFAFQAFATVYAVLIVSTTLHPGSPFSRFLELPALRFIGRISYSLYIWQQFWMWPVIWAPEIWLHRHPSLCVPLLFASAVASYYWVELPLVRVGHRIAKRYDLPRPAAKQLV